MYNTSMHICKGPQFLICICIYNVVSVYAERARPLTLLEKKARNIKQPKWVENKGEKRCKLIFFFTTMIQRGITFQMFN